MGLFSEPDRKRYGIVPFVAFFLILWIVLVWIVHSIQMGTTAVELIEVIVISGFLSALLSGCVAFARLTGEQPE